MTIHKRTRKLVEMLINQNKNVPIPMHNRKMQKVMSIECGNALLQEFIFSLKSLLVQV